MNEGFVFSKSVETQWNISQGLECCSSLQSFWGKDKDISGVKQPWMSLNVETGKRCLICSPPPIVTLILCEGLLVDGMAHPPLNEFVKFGRKILGAGINYRSLIASRNLSTPKEPIIFLKCSSSYITEGQSIVVPQSFHVNQEVELGIVIGKVGKDISENEAFEYVGGYCLALDMTESKLMERSRKEGLPWTLGKAFDTACPVSRFITKAELPNPEDVRIFSKVNNQVVQDSSTSDLLFTIPKLISFISQYITLEPGDLILTGSPAGAGPVKSGDVIECGIGNILTMKFPVKSA